MKILAVLSGGLDSSVALASESELVQKAVFFNYGSKHNLRELESAKKIAIHYKKELIIVGVPFASWGFKSNLLASQGDIPEGHYEDESMKSTVVPFRNGIMLSIAAGIAESHGLDAILIGSHFGDHAIYPDCRKSFNEPMKQAIAQGTYNSIELLTPFESMTKREIVTVGSVYQVPMELTYSCYNGQEKHCGKCGTCVERIEAFKLANVRDYTQYEGKV